MRCAWQILFFILPLSSLCQKLPLQEGDIAPSFSLGSNTLENISSVEFKGSVWLVEFWASWCLPSRKHHISLTRTHKNYKDKRFKQGRKFNIASISIDTNKKLWDLAVIKDGLPWKNQLCDLQGWNSPLISLYRVTKIPANFLVDAGGKIIAKDIWAEKLDSVLLNMMP